MAGTTHLSMHQEHMQWRNESDHWRDDLAIWEKEIDDAIGRIPELESALRRHNEMLRTHAAAVRLYEQDPGKHEQLLAEFEKGESPEPLVQLAKSHLVAAEQHERLHETHAEFKNRQRRLMTKWRQLFIALAHAKSQSSKAPAR